MTRNRVVCGTNRAVCRGFVALLAMIWPFDVVRAQPARPRSLDPANASLSHEFRLILSARELPDGRVLIASATPDYRLVVADFGSGNVRPVGREGNGPGEYRSVRDLWALRGDSTLADAWGQRRWLILASDRIVGMIPSWGAQLGGARLSGVDSAGHILELRGYRYGTSKTEIVLPLQQNAESSFVLLHDPAARIPESRSKALVDTLASLRGPWTGIRWPRRGSEPGMGISYELHGPLDTEDQAVLFPDGWLVIARVNPYRVEWRRPDGVWVRGPVLAYSVTPVDESEKLNALRTTYRRFTDARLFSSGDYPPWPAIAPPFLRDALLRGPDGHVAIRRYRTARETRSSYDIIDRRGVLRSRLEVAPAQRIIAFGVRSVYVAESNDDGLEQLRRHPWP